MGFRDALDAALAELPEGEQPARPPAAPPPPGMPQARNFRADLEAAIGPLGKAAPAPKGGFRAALDAAVGAPRGAAAPPTPTPAPAPVPPAPPAYGTPEYGDWFYADRAKRLGVTTPIKSARQREEAYEKQVKEYEPAAVEYARYRERVGEGLGPDEQAAEIPEGAELAAAGVTVQPPRRPALPRPLGEVNRAWAAQELGRTLGMTPGQPRPEHRLTAARKPISHDEDNALRGHAADIIENNRDMGKATAALQYALRTNPERFLEHVRDYSERTAVDRGWLAEVWEGLKRSFASVGMAGENLAALGVAAITDDKEFADIVALWEQAIQTAKGHDPMRTTVGQAAEQAAPMIVSAFTGSPAAATAFWTGYIYPQAYSEIRTAGGSHEGAMLGALATSTAEALVEISLGKLGSGRYGATIFKDVKGKPAREAIKTAFRNAIKEYPRELAEEGIQRASRLLTQKVMANLGDTVDDPALLRVLEESIAEMGQAALPLAVLMAAGVPASALRGTQWNAALDSALTEAETGAKLRAKQAGSTDAEVAAAGQQARQAALEAINKAAAAAEAIKRANRATAEAPSGTQAKPAPADVSGFAADIDRLARQAQPSAAAGEAAEAAPVAAPAAAPVEAPAPAAEAPQDRTAFTVENQAWWAEHRDEVRAEEAEATDAVLNPDGTFRDDVTPEAGERWDRARAMVNQMHDFEANEDAAAEAAEWQEAAPAAEPPAERVPDTTPYEVTPQGITERWTGAQVPPGYRTEAPPAVEVGPVQPEGTERGPEGAERGRPAAMDASLEGLTGDAFRAAVTARVRARDEYLAALPDGRYELVDAFGNVRQVEVTHDRDGRGHVEHLNARGERTGADLRDDLLPYLDSTGKQTPGEQLRPVAAPPSAAGAERGRGGVGVGEVVSEAQRPAESPATGRQGVPITADEALALVKQLEKSNPALAADAARYFAGTVENPSAALIGMTRPVPEAQPGPAKPVATLPPVEDRLAAYDRAKARHEVVRKQWNARVKAIQQAAARKDYDEVQRLRAEQAEFAATLEGARMAVGAIGRELRRRGVDPATLRRPTAAKTRPTPVAPAAPPPAAPGPPAVPQTAPKAPAGPAQGPAAFDIEAEGRAMGMTEEQIAQARAEGVTSVLGLRRIEKNTRAFAPPAEAPAKGKEPAIRLDTQVVIDKAERRVREYIASNPEREMVAENLVPSMTQQGFAAYQTELDRLDDQAYSMSAKEWADRIYFQSPNGMMNWGRPTERPLTRQEAAILNRRNGGRTDLPNVEAGDFPNDKQSRMLNGELRGDVIVAHGIWNQERRADHRALTEAAAARGQIGAGIQDYPDLAAKYAPAQAEAPEKGKEPWEMTQAEALRVYDRRALPKGTQFTGTASEGNREARLPDGTVLRPVDADARFPREWALMTEPSAHAAEVAVARDAGETIPPEVQANYPHLFGLEEPAPPAPPRAGRVFIYKQKQYRQNPQRGSGLAGGWDFEYKGAWHEVKDINIRKELDTLAAKYAPAPPAAQPSTAPAQGQAAQAKEAAQRPAYVRTDKGFIPVEATPVTLKGGEALDTFIHKSVDSAQKVVTEGRSGLALGIAATDEAAIAEAEAQIKKRGVAAIEAFVSQHTARGGVSPRWEGRFEPAEKISIGDKVARTFPAIGGIPLRVTGTVYRGKDGWRVRIDAGQPLGGAKTQPLTIEWAKVKETPRGEVPQAPERPGGDVSFAPPGGTETPHTPSRPAGATPEELAAAAGRTEADAIREADDVIRQAQAEADAELKKQQTRGAGFPFIPAARKLIGPSQRTPVSPQMKARLEATDPDPEISRRYDASHGRHPASWLSEKLDMLKDAFHKLSRAYEFLPKSERFTGAREYFRLAAAVGPAQADAAARLVALWENLTPDQRALVHKFFNVMDALESASIGAEGELLGHGYTRQMYEDGRMATQAKELLALVQADPEVAQAVKTRHDVVAALAQRMRAKGVLQRGVDREWYVHHDVELLQAGQPTAGARRPHQKRYAWQKKRALGDHERAPELDYNTDLLQTDMKWITEALVAERKLDIFNTFIRPYHAEAMAVLQADADAWNAAHPAGPQRSAMDFIHQHPEFGQWQWDEGNAFFPVWVVPTQLAQDAIASGGVEVKMPVAQFREMLAVGPPKETLVLPVEIVQQLAKQAEAPKIPKGLTKFWAGLQKGWKAWATALGPNTFQFYVRNLSGDIEAAVMGSPGIMKEMPRAFNLLWKYYYERESLLPRELEAARDLAVMAAGFAETEMPHVDKQRIFRQFYEDLSLHGRVTGAIDRVRRFHTFRESVTRLAAFLWAQKAIAAGQMGHFGASRAADIQKLARDFGVDYAAARYARDLIGDYGEMTVFGNWLRSYLIPFWSFQEITFKRYPRILVNALQAKAYGKAAAVLPSMAFRALAASRLAWFYAATWLWNNLLYPDEERKLADWEKGPHLILGTRVDGSTKIFRRFGASSELLEWFGLDTIMQYWPKVEAGQATVGDMAVAMSRNLANKAVSGVNPIIKGVAEQFTGRAIFPDVTRSRPKDRSELAFGILGLEDEWNELRGRGFFGIFEPTGERARPGWLERHFYGISNPGPNALSEVSELIRDFKEHIGKGTSDYIGKPGPLRTMRKAAEAGDAQAFAEAARLYVRTGKDYQDFRQALDRMHPLGDLARADRDLFIRGWLRRPRDVEMLNIAEDHYMRLKPAMLDMWRGASDALRQERRETEDERRRIRRETLDRGAQMRQGF